MPSALKEVRNFDEDLASVVCEMLRKASQVAERIHGWRAGKVLQVAVIIPHRLRFPDAGKAQRGRKGDFL